VGEDFKEDFNRKFENCTIQVRCRSKEEDRNVDAHPHWSGPVVSFVLLCASRGSPSPTSVLATSLSRRWERLWRGKWQRRRVSPSNEDGMGVLVEGGLGAPRGCGDLHSHAIPFKVSFTAVFEPVGTISRPERKEGQKRPLRLTHELAFSRTS